MRDVRIIDGAVVTATAGVSATPTAPTPRGALTVDEVEALLRRRLDRPAGQVDTCEAWAVAEIDRIRAALLTERAAAEEREVAFIAALQELAEWPDLPGVRFGTILNRAGHTEDWTLRPEQVTGIYEGILKHAETLLPFGAEAVKARQEIDGVRARLTEARESLRVAGEERDDAHRKIDLYEVELDRQKALIGPALKARAAAERDLAALRRTLEEDEAIFRWLLGEEGEFPESLPGHRYNFRGELRKRLAARPSAPRAASEASEEGTRMWCNAHGYDGPPPCPECPTPLAASAEETSGNG